jgi:hypothetical protein
MLDKSDFEKYPKTYILSYKQSEKPKDLELTLSKETSCLRLFSLEINLSNFFVVLTIQ